MFTVGSGSDHVSPPSVDVLSETVRLFPDCTQAHVFLGSALISTKHYGEAIIELNHALKLAPNLELARFDLAVAQIQMHNKPAAIEQYSFLKSTNPTIAEQLYRLIFENKLLLVKKDE